MEIDLSAQPSNILAFDSTKKREPEPVNLDTPFFTVKHTHYPDCDHRNAGVTLDVARRVAVCKCGVEIDCFDALLIYAHAQRRLVETKEFIKEHRRKEEEKKAKRPFVRDIGGYSQIRSSRGHFRYYDITLSCGHHLSWTRKKLPRRATCEICFKNAQLRASGAEPINRTSTPSAV